jgi:hypothetical protein
LCFFFAIILESEKPSMNGSNATDWKKDSGLGRILTGDLRRVKTEALALGRAFSCLSAALFDAEEMTTRKASAPS